MRISTLRTKLSNALVEFLWDEWAQMGLLAAPHHTSRWAQDPEALLLLTLEMARDDPRLFDEVLDWLVQNVSVMSARRVRTLCIDTEDEQLSAAALEWAARHSRPASSRRKLEDRSPAKTPLFRDEDFVALRVDEVFSAFGFTRPTAEPSGKSRTPDFAAPINFAFRLRLLLGVGARAEAVRYLLTSDADSSLVADVARSAGYSKRNTQEALTSLEAAGTLTRAAKRGEQRYVVDRTRWAHLLGIEAHELPVYRDWPRLFGALRRVSRWLARPDLETLSEYLLASQAADVLDVVRPELSRAGVIMPARLGRERSWTDLEETVEFALLSLGAGDMPRGRPAAFEVIPDTSGGFRWRLTTSAGRIVASSPDAYASAAAATAAAERLREASERLKFRVTQDAGVYLWHVAAENGRVVAASTEVFASARDAERAARDARDLASGAAPATENTSHRIDPTRRHVTLRPDGRWQVKAEGATRAASTHQTQADAVRSARRQALRDPRGAEVVVHGRDGHVRSSEVVASE